MMELVRGLHNLGARHHGCVLTIGNYDGIHLGHQAVMAALRAEGHALSLPAAVMTFEPTPREFFAPANAPPRLSSLREKVQDIAATGIDTLLVARFDRAFAALSPQTFIEDLVIARLGARLVMVGADFCFGAERAGNVAMLEQHGQRHGLTVRSLPAVDRGGERVSSTRVRAALAAGEPRLAAALLGRDYRISGRVASGARLGRTLGVPTANLRLRRPSAPAFGVYAVRARLADGRMFDGAASLGTRPTVNGSDCLLETYLLNFDGDLYDQRLEVYLRHYLRAEARFETTAALREQMQADIAQVRALFAADRTAATRADSP